MVVGETDAVAADVAIELVYDDGETELELPADVAIGLVYDEETELELPALLTGELLLELTGLLLELPAAGEDPSNIAGPGII